MHEYDDSDDFDDLPDKPSKSARKRAMQHLQDLGQRIGALKPEQIASLALPERLNQAMAELKRLKAREAIRRHLQYIGKLMRETDAEALEARVNALTASGALEKTRFKNAERWRDRFIEQGFSGEALQAFHTQYPEVDADLLKQHVDEAWDDHQKGMNRGKSKLLFRFLYDQLA